MTKVIHREDSELGVVVCARLGDSGAPEDPVAYLTERTPSYTKERAVAAAHTLMGAGGTRYRREH